MPFKNNKSSLLLATLVFCLLIISTRIVEASLQHQKTFTIKAGLENYQSTVKLDNVACSFKFSTIACSELKKKEEPKKEEKTTIVSYSEAIKRLSKATCLNKVEGYWTYSYCLEGKIKQNHGAEVYQLGTFSKYNQDKGIFDNGEECALSGGKKVRRSTDVIYMCGMSTEIVSIREPQQCKYELIVTDPQLCGKDSPFPSYHHETSTSSITETSIYDHFEMKIEKTLFDNQYLCTVQSILRDLKSKPTSCFTYFSMTLDGKEDESSLTARAMHHGRIPFKNEELKYTKNGKQVKTTSSFDGSLDYIQVK
ncbi:predicted protein [Naegleria gruberi]|uniref:Predicted protein n=1 Tax=Naegleria gruberi TaxID=5762 RepID=D2V376_NAEGR|nr:uncharacterized protein NAEGRDRAFT_63256 [Naegleria gruberi]EFC48585.1 predicted protein [Naegleria gruberi]|eukprot:XP_002681329.1 predicted protein [Naegleria gruberi strain NEG-M]